MTCVSMMALESHRSAATLYATGEITTEAVRRAAACLESLPQQVRVLCVDLRGVLRADLRAMRALEMTLRTWRAARRGMSRVKLPQEMETSLVGLKFAHRRWTPPLRFARELAAFRFRDQRQAVVTRSLRERACSETR